MLAEMGAARHLAWWLLMRDLRSQYRQALLGVLWAVIPAIATAVVLALAAKSRLLNPAEGELPYFASVFLNLVIWQLFVDALNGPVRAVSASRTLLGKIYFPREALVLAQCGEVLFNLLVKLPLLIAVLSWHGVQLHGSQLLAPLALLPLLGLGILVGAAVAPLGAVTQDVSRGLTVLTSFWFWLSPVAYAPAQSGTLATLMSSNPVTPLMITTRELVLGVPLTHPAGFGVVSVGVGVALLLVWVGFRLAMPFVIERIGA